MKTRYKFLAGTLFTFIILAWYGCTKVESGFLSPYVQYAVNEFSIIRGRTSKSYSLITDGSSIPMKVRWLHIYDESGKMVDSLFSKKYPVTIWTAGYDSKTDVTYAAITAKQTTVELTPIVINESNGTIEANASTLNLPLGKYTMDLEVSNEAGTQTLPKIMTIYIVDGKSVETAPEQGAFAVGRAIAGTAPVTYFYNGANNPYVIPSIIRIADTPNVFVLKFTDMDGIPFNPKAGEVFKRPAAGLNPVPPFLQNLQDYAPDTYVATDSSISIKFPLVPFPIASLGNGFNMYYNIKTSVVQIDSTSSWSGNTAGVYYKGPSDTHYLGTYQNGRYDYSIRVPLRIHVPGSYELTVKILNVKHR